MEYKIIGSTHSYQLETQINELAEQGWEVHSFATDDGGYVVIMHRMTE
jgi:hypothetical protein